MLARTMQRAVAIVAAFVLLALQPAAAQNSDPFQEAAPPVAAPAPTPPRTRPTPAPPPEVEQPMPQSGNAPLQSAELVFWQSISASTNPADFEEYLRTYPNGQFAGLARNRLAVLRSPPVAGPSTFGAPQAAPGQFSTGYDGNYGGDISMVPVPNGTTQTNRYGGEYCNPALMDKIL